MTPEERAGAAQEVIDLFKQRDELEFQLNLIMATDIPPRVKNIRIKYVTSKIVELKNEVYFRIVSMNADHGDPGAKALLEQWASEGNEKAKAFLAGLG